MTTDSNVQRQLPAPAPQEQHEQSPIIQLAMICIVIVWIIVFIAGIGIAKGAWASWWTIVGLGVFTAICAGVIVGIEKYKAHQLHQEDLKDRVHHRAMAELAIRADHSAEHITRTSSLRTVSLYMGPASHVNIRDNTLGTALSESLPIAPSFSQIVPQVRTGHLFLGQGATGPIWGDVTDLLSTLNIGRPGTGKSTLLRDVYGQLMVIGGQATILDPHGSILDDIGTTVEVAETPKEIEDTTRLLEKTLDQRLAARRAGYTGFSPHLLIADEIPVISLQAQKAIPVISRIVSEGRKVLMFAIISGVGCPADILGGSIVRDAMSSRYVFCTTTRQASMAGIDSEVAKPLLQQLDTAGPGRAILGRAGFKPEIVGIPNTTIDDLRSLIPDRFPGTSRPLPTEENLSNGNKDGQQWEVDFQTLQIVRKMLSEERGQTEIIEQAFPNMRSSEATKLYRHYLSYLIAQAKE